MAVCGGCSLFIPTTAQILQDPCDRSVDVFKVTGEVTCGHVTWDIHPQHAALLPSNVLSYLKKYDDLYRSFKKYLGREPKEQRVKILEQCSYGSARNGKPCPNGPLESDAGAMYVWRGFDILSCFSGFVQFISPSASPFKSHDPKYTIIHVNDDFFARAFPSIASDPNMPISASLIHEFGHVFMPFQEGDDAYIWDPILIESFASFFGVVAVLIPNEIEERGEKYYWDGWCLLHGKPDVCNDYFETLEQSFGVGYTMRWDSFVQKGPEGSLHHYFTDMLSTLYREYVASGDLVRYEKALEKTFQFYHGMKHIPFHWKQDQGKLQPSFVVQQKVNVFIFLLSVFMQEDMSDRFREWGYPITDKTKQGIYALKQERWAESAIQFYIFTIQDEGIRFYSLTKPIL
ncbi:MAG: hypothetical protein Q7R79_03060 [bacterium]|nr:hypothetical protein [bacterium]